MKELYGKYQEDVQFLIVYIREAHALDSRSPAGGNGNPIVEDPTTFIERQSVARVCMAKLELSEIPSLPASLEEALTCLEEDHEFLLKGDVFTEDVIDTWIEYKREKEITPVNNAPSPVEFELYYDI